MTVSSPQRLNAITGGKSSNADRNLLACQRAEAAKIEDSTIEA